MRVIKDSGMVLAHWIYTREEWNCFLEWERRRNGWVRYIISRMVSSNSSQLPEITITGEKVKLNENTHVFQNEAHRLIRVHVRESGNINILEIFYQARSKKIKVIRVPVPRGSLRQAMSVQECLAGYAS